MDRVTPSQAESVTIRRFLFAPFCPFQKTKNPTLHWDGMGWDGMPSFCRRSEGDGGGEVEVELGGTFEADGENGEFIGSRRQTSFEERRWASVVGWIVG